MKILMLNYEFPPLGGGAANACYYKGNLHYQPPKIYLPIPGRLSGTPVGLLRKMKPLLMIFVTLFSVFPAVIWLWGLKRDLNCRMW